MKTAPDRLQARALRAALTVALFGLCLVLAACSNKKPLEEGTTGSGGGGGTVGGGGPNSVGTNDLDYLPRDAGALMSFQFGEWKRSSPLAGKYRELTKTALGQEMMTKMADEAGFSADDVERVSFGVPADSLPSFDPNAGSLPEYVVAVSFAQPFKRDKMLVNMFPAPGEFRPGGAPAAPAGPNADEVKHGSFTFYKERPSRFAPPDRKQTTCMCFVNDRLLVIAGPTEAAMKRALDASGKPAQNLTAKFTQMLGQKKHLVAALDVTKLPAAVRAGAPKEYAPLVQARELVLTADLKADLLLEAALRFPDDRTAGDAEKVLKGLLDMGRAALPLAMGMIPKELTWATAWAQDAQKAVTGAAPRRAGPEVTLKMAVPIEKGLTDAIAEVNRAVPKVKEAAERLTSQNNLKQIAIAMHNYHNDKGGLPPAAIRDKSGKPLLSWRVAILPYVEQDALFRQFKFDEPWDGPNNKKLLAQMPKVYALPGKLAGAKTHYQVFVGGGALFDPPAPNPKAPDPGIGVSFAKVPDGTSNTLLVVEAEQGVDWTKPEDLTYDPKKPVPKLGFFWGDACNVALGDGAVRPIRKGITEQTLRGLITRAGGETVIVP